MINKFEQDYRGLCNIFLANELAKSKDVEDRKDRTGVGCKSVFGKHLEFDLSRGKFPLLTGRAIYKNVYFNEFLWFMSGSTNIKHMQDAGVKIWDAWADENGDLGTGTYGDSMRNWNNEGLDQFEELIHNIKTNPHSRRLKIQLWNPRYTKTMALPTCYNAFNFFYQSGILHMSVDMRSCDLFLGLPYDCALFATFLIYVCKETDLSPGRIKINFNDLHVYNNHFDALKEYIIQPILKQPSFEFTNSGLTGFLRVLDYPIRSIKNITAPVAV